MRAGPPTNPAIGAVLGLALAAAGATAAPTARSRAPTLLPMSRDQVMEAGAAGTGCSWSPTHDRRTRFAAADDRAVVRLPSGIVSLRPAQEAKDLFPFTYDRWVGGGLAVSVRPHGRSVRKGSEASVQPAVLSVRSGGVTVRLQGRIDCGA